MENQIQNPEDNQEIENMEQFQVKRSFGEEELGKKDVVDDIRNTISNNDPGDDDDDLIDDDEDIVDDDDDIVDEDDDGDADDVGGDLAGNAAGNEDIVDDDDEDD